MNRRLAVLFVDDEDVTLRALQRGLINQDFDCLYAHNAEQALILMEQKEVAVVVSDLKMPKMDGLTFMRIVKEKWPLSVRIVMTGYLNLSQMVASLNSAEVFKIITKPWRLDEDVLHAVREGIRKFLEQEQVEENKRLIRARNTNYNNVMKRVNANIDATRHYASFIGDVASALLKELSQDMGKDLDPDATADYLMRVGECIDGLKKIANTSYATYKINFVLENLKTLLENAEQINRTDFDAKPAEGLEIRLKEGLLEHCFGSLIGHLLPGIHKYVKIFGQKSEQAGMNSIFAVISPIQREEDASAVVKNKMVALWIKVMGILCESWGGKFDMINKGTKVLLRIDLPKPPIEEA